MASTLDKRLTAVEKRLAALTRQIKGRPKDWRKAVGTLRDTKLGREADALGQQFRSGQRKP